MNTTATKKSEITYEDVKKMAFYFFETMSRLANHSFTEEQIAARKAKGQAITLMQAINEVITPDDVMGVDPITKETIVVGHKPNKYSGSYKCYSQRCFDQGNAGDPYEYTGVQFNFRLANGISITVDTKYANIRAQFYSAKYDIGIGRKLCKELDDLGAALWQDWDDAPESLIEKMRQCEDEDAWWDDDYMYTERKTWSRPTEYRNYSKLESDFERDCRGGVRYTQREWDGHAGLYFNGEVRRFYQAVLAEQERARRECREADARREQYKVKAPGKMITWENMTEEQREEALKLYREKKASE